MWQARRDSNPQHPDLESDALPLELLACIIRFDLIKINVFQGRRIAFGIVDDQLNCTGSVCHYRHYRIKRATDSIRLFGLLVRRVLSAKPAIFIKLQLIRGCSLILGRRIISSFAFSAC